MFVCVYGENKLISMLDLYISFEVTIDFTRILFENKLKFVVSIFQIIIIIIDLLLKFFLFFELN